MEDNKQGKSVTFRIIKTGGREKEAEVKQDDNSFHVTVQNVNYRIEVLLNRDFALRYRVYNADDYLFTIELDYDESWFMKDIAQPVSMETLYRIGEGIEDHYGQPLKKRSVDQ